MRCIFVGGVLGALTACGVSQTFAQQQRTPSGAERRIGQSPNRDGTRPNQAGGFGGEGIESIEAQIRSLCESRDFRAALQRLDQAISRESEEEGKPGFARRYARIYELRGRIRVSLNDYTSALEDWNRAIVLDPASAELRCTRSSLYRLLKNPREAHRDLVEAIRVDPRYAEAYICLADLLEAQGDLEDAIERLTEGLRQCGDQSSLLRRRARLLVEKKDCIAAMHDIDRWIVLAPRDAAAYFERSQINLALADNERAEADLDVAVGLQPQAPYLLLERAKFHRFCGTTSKALPDITAAIRLDPKYVEAYLFRADFYEEMGEIELAVQDYDRAVEIGKGDPSLLRRRASFLQSHGMISEALADYSAAIRINPRNVDCYFDQAALLAKQGSFRDAIEVLSKAIEIEPTSGAYEQRANLWLAAREPEKAIQDMNQAVSLAPSEPFLYIARENMYRRLGKRQEADADKNRAMQLIGSRHRPSPKR